MTTRPCAGERLGLMRLAPRRPGEGFDERDERLLSDIAAHAGGAVASAFRELELRAAHSAPQPARPPVRTSFDVPPDQFNPYVT